ncbi:MAG TPA: glycosyltransferase family 9 protein [Anaerolineae bacterium]|nr:glycosyltransferase family 9 protein [Anaerolineae bacterium]
MPVDTLGIRLAAQLLYLPWQLLGAHPPLSRPKKVLMLKPGSLSEVLLATPLLTVLHEAYPQARFDWVVGSWERPAIASNRRIRQLIDAGKVGQKGGAWGEVTGLIERIANEGYDTCFIPSESALLAYVAWRAGIPQRIGLRGAWTGFAHTIGVKPGPEVVHEAERYLALARVFQLRGDAPTFFEPTDDERQEATRLLMDVVGWDQERPLIILHPGGGIRPDQTRAMVRWPAERFALLANHLQRSHDAEVVLLGLEAEAELVTAVKGMMSNRGHCLAGQVSLGVLGALAEVADLYVGHDTGATHVAAAVGCPTLALFGPTEPAVSQPYSGDHTIIVVRDSQEGGFSWSDKMPPEQVIMAADHLLKLRHGLGMVTG